LQAGAMSGSLVAPFVLYTELISDGLVKSSQSGHCERSEAISYFLGV